MPFDPQKMIRNAIIFSIAIWIVIAVIVFIVKC